MYVSVEIFVRLHIPASDIYLNLFNNTGSESPSFVTFKNTCSQRLSHLLCLLAVGDGAGRIPAGLKGQVVVSLDQGQVVACTQMRLQEERGAYAAQLAMGNDGDAVTQDVSLIHVMRGQDDGAA